MRMGAWSMTCTLRQRIEYHYYYCDSVFSHYPLGDIPRSKSESLWVDTSTTSDQTEDDNIHVNSGILYTVNKATGLESNFHLAPPLPPKPMNHWPYTIVDDDDQTGDSGLGTGSGAVQYGELEEWKRAIMIPPPST